MANAIVIAAFLFFASIAAAGPIVVGNWESLVAANNDGNPFFDNTSWDGRTCNLAYEFQPSGVEYLAGTWRLPYSVQFTALGGTSDYLEQHVLTHDLATGVVSLDSGHDYTASSISWGAVLLRRSRGPCTQYWFGFEDLPPWHSDFDYQDRKATWTECTTLPPDHPQSVPEPGPMMLLTIAAAIFVIRHP